MFLDLLPPPLKGTNFEIVKQIAIINVQNEQDMRDAMSIKTKYSRNVLTGKVGWATLPHFAVACFVVLCLAGCKKNTVSSAPPGPPWVAINKSNSQIIDNHVNCLYTDDSGIVWVGTDQGASYYIRGSWSQFVDDLAYTTYSNGSQQTMHSVTCVTQGIDASIWFGTRGGGIFQYAQFGQSYTWKRYTTNDGIPYNLILSVDRVLASSNDALRGQIWCATIAGVASFTPLTGGGGVWKTYTSTSPGCSLPSNQVRAVAFNININNDNTDYSMWFGTSMPAGAAYIGRSGWQSAVLLSSPYDLPISAIAFDALNTGWFAKWQGVSSYNIKTFEWRHYTNANTNGGLPPGTINALAIDIKSSSRTRWFGSNAGLIRFTDTVWTKYTRSNTALLPSDTITSLTFDRNHNLWIGTPGGIAVYNETGTIF